METNLKTEIKVGIFALAGLILFCLSVILLGGDKWFLTKTYSLRVRLPQSQGLARGSVVSLTGVPVGNVDDVVFVSGSNEVELVLSLQEAVQSRITEGSKVAVKTQGALGDKFVFIEPGPPGGQPLANGALIEVDKTPDLIDMISNKGAELGEVVHVIKEVRQLFEAINRDGRSQKLMVNLVESSDNFNKGMQELRETMRSLKTDAIQPMASVLKKIDNGQGTIGALINDSSLHNRLSTMLGEAPRNRFLKPMIRDSIQTSEEKR